CASTIAARRRASSSPGVTAGPPFRAARAGEACHGGSGSGPFRSTPPSPPRPPPPSSHERTRDRAPRAGGPATSPAHGGPARLAPRRGPARQDPARRRREEPSTAPVTPATAAGAHGRR